MNRRSIYAKSCIAISSLLLVVFSLPLSASNLPSFFDFNEKNARAQTPARDLALEAQLDALMDADFVPSDTQALDELLRDVDVNTPIETFVRAQGYQILRLAMQDNLTAALVIAEEVEQLATAADNLNAIAEINVIIAEAHVANEKFDKASTRVERILELLPRVSNVRIRFHANHLVARILQNNNDTSDALEYLLAAQALLPLTEAQGQQRRRHFLSLHLARIQANLGRWAASMATAENAIEDTRRTGIRTHLPDLYLVRAYSKQYQNGPSQSIVDAFLEAAQVARDMGNARVEMLSYNNAGATKLHLNELNDATQYLQQGLVIARRIGNINERSVTEFNLGYIKVLQEQYDAGITEMLAAAEVFNGFALKREQAILLTHIARAYELAGRYQEQAETLKKQAALRQEVAETQREQQINELQVRYEAAEKSYEIKLLEQQAELQRQELASQERKQDFVVLAGAFMLVLLIVFAGVYRKTRKLNLLLNKANAELQEQSLRDPLTGLHNRRAIYDRLLRDEQRIYTGNHAVFILDIDHFKTINDKYGHSIGDEVLIEFGRRLKQATRSSDMAIRWGGEEFLLILENVQTEQVMQVARKLLTEIGEKPFHTSAGRLHITLSGGCTVMTSAKEQMPPNWDDTVRLVDELLYQAKNEGRNRIRYQPDSGPRETIYLRP
ncbi:diguanylate cyclase [Pseudidiomarina sp. 1ASP75-14]|uniref:GGDEF domain-containing protein n=1 Tax=Pseudidiomarina terrestris TaxID=2820060 RepID=UPI00264F0F85|nr:GGDEF domain-containing protein [Pseudidiomarina sp. 1ASP75-14]MDN7138742.1 diguanylate cyclase [Pseudidiomarina sp. 1ASP75-14]